LTASPFRAARRAFFKWPPIVACSRGRINSRSETLVIERAVSEKGELRAMVGKHKQDHGGEHHQRKADPSEIAQLRSALKLPELDDFRYLALAARAFKCPPVVARLFGLDAGKPHFGAAVPADGPINDPLRSLWHKLNPGHLMAPLSAFAA
jgi:hypothetical protein